MKNEFPSLKTGYVIHVFGIKPDETVVYKDGELIEGLTNVELTSNMEDPTYLKLEMYPITKEEKRKIPE